MGCRLLRNFVMPTIQTYRHFYFRDLVSQYVKVLRWAGREESLEMIQITLLVDEIAAFRP